MYNLELTIASPLRVLLKETSHMVLLPALEGEIGVLYNHIPVIVSLNFGLIKLVDSKNKITTSFYIDGGVARVTNTSVDVICNYMTESNGLNTEKLSAKMKLIASLAGKNDKMEFYKKIHQYLQQQ
jgi:F-type H+-transporting ATPase subunit epsilon